MTTSTTHTSFESSGQMVPVGRERKTAFLLKLRGIIAFVFTKKSVLLNIAFDY